MNFISVIILVGNEVDLIFDAVKSCSFANEIILVAANSNKSVIANAKKANHSIKVVETNDSYNRNFTKWRNLGLQKASGDWVLYVDADERITPSLQVEILQIISKDDTQIGCYVIPRANFFLGKRVKYGGTYPDYVKRLYKRSLFRGYQGDLHEEPVFSGTIGYLSNNIIHYTHRDLTSMLQKSLVWTDMEAQLLYKSGHPPVVWWRFIRMIITKFYQRFFLQQMWRDGIVGLISSIFESFDTFMIYAKLWELQQRSNKG